MVLAVSQTYKLSQKASVGSKKHGVSMICNSNPRSMYPLVLIIINKYLRTNERTFGTCLLVRSLVKTQKKTSTKQPKNVCEHLYDLPVQFQPHQQYTLPLPMLYPYKIIIQPHHQIQAQAICKEMFKIQKYFHSMIESVYAFTINTPQ